MELRFFHQNMRKWGGVSRTVDFTKAYGDMRYNGSMRDAILVIAAGFTEIVNASDNTLTHLNEIAAKLAKKGVEMGPVYLTPAGVNQDYEVTEYIGVSLWSSATASAWGYCHLYKSTNVLRADPKFFARSFIGKNQVLPKPPSQREEMLPNGATELWNLIPDYRGIAFVAADLDARPFIVGFMHNVCQIGDPSISIKAMPQAFTAIRDKVAAIYSEFQDAPIIVGGDFNVRPSKPSASQSTTTIFPRAAAFKNPPPTYRNTTSANPLDFWFYNKKPFNIGKTIEPGNTDCFLHNEAFVGEYFTKNDNSVQLTDHMGISITVG